MESVFVPETVNEKDVGNYDKKLTLTALIEEVRLSTEQEVINKLFG